MGRIAHIGNMKNGTSNWSKALKKKRLSVEEDSKNDLDYQLVILSVDISHAEGIDNPSRSTISASDRLYKVVAWVEPDIEYKSKRPVHGLPNPRFNTGVDIEFGASLLDWGFLHVEVLRLHNDSEPGTSSGIASVSRARIPLPKKMNQKIEGRFGLVRNEGPGMIKAEGHIILSMKVKQLIRL